MAQDFFKLKNPLCVDYDQETDSYLFPFEDKPPKKVSSRMFPILLGKSKFSSIGYGVLERCRLLEPPEEIDSWYKLRGAIGEYFIDKELHRQFSKVDGFATQQFYTTQFKHMDQFHESYSYGNSKYGGTIDIAVKSPSNMRAVVECKSKSEKQRKYIDEKLNNPNAIYEDEECMQGAMLADLSKVDNVIMGYSLFSEFTENKIKNIMFQFEDVDDFRKKEVEKGIDLAAIKQKDIIYIFKRFKLDHDKMKELMQKAYDTLHACHKNKRIPKSFFSEQEQKYLDSVIVGMPF